MAPWPWLAHVDEAVLGVAQHVAHVLGPDLRHGPCEQHDAAHTRRVIACEVDVPFRRQHDPQRLPRGNDEVLEVEDHVRRGRALAGSLQLEIDVEHQPADVHRVADLDAKPGRVGEAAREELQA